MASDEPGAHDSGLTLDDAYEILGLERNASDDQVRSRYREQVRMHHPDKGGSSTEFIRTHWAYKTIADDRSTRQDEGDDLDPRLAALLDLVVSLIEYIDEQSWSDFWKGIAMALVGVGGVAAAYALYDDTDDDAQ